MCERQDESKRQIGKLNVRVGGMIRARKPAKFDDLAIPRYSGYRFGTCSFRDGANYFAYVLWLARRDRWELSSYEAKFLVRKGFRRDRVLHGHG